MEKGERIVELPFSFEYLTRKEWISALLNSHCQFVWEEEEEFAGLRRCSVGLGPLPLLLVGGNSPMHQARKSPVEKGGEEELSTTAQRRQTCSLRRSSPQRLRSGSLDADRRSCIEDHVNFTLRQAYFKCAFECFDRKKKPEEIGSCVEYCSVPVVNAQNAVQNEISQFQEKLQRSLMVCQDKFEAAKLKPNKGDVVKGLESYVDQSVQDGIKTLPHIVGKLKTSLRMTDNYMIRQSEVESGFLGASYVAGNCSARRRHPRSPTFTCLVLIFLPFSHFTDFCR
nr:protein FAM136A-like [Ipomoea trifida]